jgi:hypothetical protein
VTVSPICNPTMRHVVVTGTLLTIQTEGKFSERWSLSRPLFLYNNTNVIMNCTQVYPGIRAATTRTNKMAGHATWFQRTTSKVYNQWSCKSLHEWSPPVACFPWPIQLTIGTVLQSCTQFKQSWCWGQIQALPPPPHYQLYKSLVPSTGRIPRTKDQNVPDPLVLYRCRVTKENIIIWPWLVWNSTPRP